MNNIVKRIMEYQAALSQLEKSGNLHNVSRKEFTFLLGGMSSFRKIPGIHKHMGFEELNICENEEDAMLVKEHLKRLFGIQDFDTLMRTCYTKFAVSGEYEQFMTFWKDAPLFDVEQLEWQGRKAFEMCKGKAGYFYPFLQEKGFYAYDISERITLCRAAVACGLISEAQFYEVTDEWVRLAQVFYSSYEEYAISYICGALYDMSRYEDTDLEQYLNLNMQLADMLLADDRPWRTNSWYEPEKREWVDVVGNSLGCFITKKALDNGYIGYMYHEEPANNDYPDSGWRFFYGDEADDYVNNVDNTVIVALNTVCNLQPDILAYIHAKNRRFGKSVTGWLEE